LKAVNFYKDSKGKKTLEDNKLIKITLDYVASKFHIPVSTLRDNVKTQKDISKGNIIIIYYQQ
jgi:hypothetical protein